MPAGPRAQHDRAVDRVAPGQKHLPGQTPLILERANILPVDHLKEMGITAIFCCDDTSAIQAVGRLKEKGVAVPKEMNLISYGNTDLARYFTPAISSVDPHNEKLVDHLIGILTGDRTKQQGIHQYMVEPGLEIRET